jgi:hypothetical protein
MAWSPVLSSAEEASFASTKRPITELPTELHARAARSSCCERWCPQAASKAVKVMTNEASRSRSPDVWWGVSVSRSYD